MKLMYASGVWSYVVRALSMLLIYTAALTTSSLVCCMLITQR
jgi:hypothetical protein